MDNKLKAWLEEDRLLSDALNSSNEIQLEINGQYYHLKAMTSPNQQGNQGKALRHFWLPTVISTLVYFVIFNLRRQAYIPLVGTDSIASITTLIGVVSAMLTFSWAFVKGKRRGQANLVAIYWRNFPTILISFTVIVGLLTLFSFYLLGAIFEGIALDIFLSTLLSFLLFAIINYGMLSLTFILSPSTMTGLLVAMMLGGVVIAMLTNSDRQWWQNNLSFLGTQEAAQAWRFNLTLIISAFIMIALVDYLFVLLKNKYPIHKGLPILRLLLSLTAISLGLVGYFTSDAPGNIKYYHNDAAAMLVIIVIVMIVGVKWFVPNASKEFILTSYIMGILLMVLTYLFLNGTYLTLTGFEIVAFVIAFSWLMLLLQNLEKLIQPASREVQLKVVDSTMGTLLENLSDNDYTNFKEKEMGDEEMAFNYTDLGNQAVITNLNKMAVGTDNFRTTIWSGTNLQLTLMTIPAGTKMGMEQHEGIDQLYTIVEGEAICQVGPTRESVETSTVQAGDSILVPANYWHDIESKVNQDVKMITVYGAVDHVPGTIHKTKQDALNDPNEH